MICDTICLTSDQASLINHCIKHLIAEYRYLYSQKSSEYTESITLLAQQILTAIAQCDSPYHNLEHTVQVVLVGQEILHGMFLCDVKIPPDEWFNFIVALLCHDIGYLKGICQSDIPEEQIFVTGTGKETVMLPPTATGASLTPYHVDRGKQFVAETLSRDYPLVNVISIQTAIELTRFPVPSDDLHKDTRQLPGLARAADLIGQLADPAYLTKLPALFQEFEETGANSALGYATPQDLRAGYPRFYWKGVSLYLKHGIRYLEMSKSGQAILANLHGNRVVVEEELDRFYGISRPIPEKGYSKGWVESR